MALRTFRATIELTVTETSDRRADERTAEAAIKAAGFLPKNLIQVGGFAS
jgi:hypothetical protein